MMGRTMVLGLMGGSLLASGPRLAEAQVAVDLRVFWTWGDDGWRVHEGPYAYDRGTYDSRRAVPRYPAQYAPVRVPPGHLPPPGFCRLWYPGRPPGHQPRPQPCGSLFRVHGGGGAVIIGGPVYHDGFRYGSAYGHDYRFDDRFERGWEGRGRGNARGRGF